MTMRQIPERALTTQAKASDPGCSVWVSANAGSGKTHVLTERVIRLLLQGTPPSRILCLTYTKAAAAVMKTRIFQRLSEWTVLDDKLLSCELTKLEGCQPDKTRLQQARRLFAHALETPGGLKIQTLHAFCEAVLHQFPLEANIAGHFEMMDEATAASLIGQARRELLTAAYSQDNAILSQDLMAILQQAGEAGLNALFEQAIAKRQEIKQFLARTDKENRQKDLYNLFQLHHDETIAVVAERLTDEASLDSQLSQFLLTARGVRIADFVDKLRQLRQLKSFDEQRALIASAYFTQEGMPRQLASVVPKVLRNKMPQVMDILQTKQDNLLQLFDKLKTLELIQLNLAAYRLLDSLLSRYDKMKKAQGLLDFDDLIYHALALLNRQDAGLWVQYKLDQGIDHILVDEAQDTSPAQWAIVQRLSEDFFSGQGQREVERTVFAVGDEKQSIYSFQGALPEAFAENGRLVARKAQQCGAAFNAVRLDYSFRSTQDVLSAVDQVFARAENYQGLSAANEKTVHEAIRMNDPGQVDIWQSFAPQEFEEPSDWRQPVDQLHAPAVQLANTIADTIAAWLKNGEVIAGKRRAMKASDIMVLVRKRDQFVPALARALKNRDVAVAGADRLRLTDHIAVRDLMALGQFVLQPHDDLALASLFKSPFFALSEQQLYAVATNRQGSLWHAVRHCDDKAVLGMVERLTDYRQLADKVPVFEFYSHVLSDDGARRDILARLGSEAGDVLDAFMDFTLTIQKTGLPGLQAFLATLETSEPQIKRELDQGREEVRIMTAHAAKGLESAIVFVVDSGSQIWSAQHEPKIVTLKATTGEVPIWLPKKELKPQKCQDVIEELKQRAHEEYRRLLYVGMTRAEDRLIICGYQKKRKVENSWLSIVTTALEPQAKPIEGPLDGIKAWRYARDVEGDKRHPETQNRVCEQPFDDLPDYFKHKMAGESALPRPLIPSGGAFFVDDDQAIYGQNESRSPILVGPQTRQSFAVERGRIMHKLLQYMPDLAGDTRHAVLRRFVGQTLGDWSAQQRQQIIDDVEHVLKLPELQALFAKGGRSEVAIMGTVMINGTVRPVSGQIDRIQVTHDRVLLGDYKTGRVPENTAAIPSAYLVQMALYRALLRPLYSDKTIESYLIYSHGPTLFKLDDQILDNAASSLVEKSNDDGQ